VSGSTPIPTPLHQRWLRLRFRLLPVLMFLVAASLGIWLWGQHSGLLSTVGEVEAIRMVITAPADGRLVIADQDWQLFQEVKEGQVLVRMDDGPSRLAIATLQKQVEQLKKQLAATRAQMEREFADLALRTRSLEYERIIRLRRLALDIEERTLDKLDRQAMVESDKIELTRLSEQYAQLEALRKQGNETPERVRDIRLQRDVVQERLRRNQDYLTEADLQLTAARKRKNELAVSPEDVPTTQPAPMETFLGPVRAGIAIVQAEMTQIELDIKNLEVCASFNGVVREIFYGAGQTIRMGEPVMTIVARDASHVVCYVRDHQRIQPQLHMKVKVRVRSLPIRTVAGTVDQVGPQVVRIPRQHLHDPQLVEWGLPIRVRIDRAAGLRPGEMVNLIFPRPQ
jgi:multidrug resistance efflux pump